MYIQNVFHSNTGYHSIALKKAIDLMRKYIPCMGRMNYMKIYMVYLGL